MGTAGIFVEIPIDSQSVISSKREIRCKTRCLRAGPLTPNPLMLGQMVSHFALPAQGYGIDRVQARRIEP
jgi:hypothetical protein